MMTSALGEKGEKMPKLIDADKAKEVLKHLLYETAMNNLDIADIYEDIIENRLDTWIELIPTVDAVPVRHGRWVKTGQSFVNPNKFRNYCCSECGLELDKQIRSKPNYCSNCGAKMD